MKTLAVDLFGARNLSPSDHLAMSSQPASNSEKRLKCQVVYLSTSKSQSQKFAKTGFSARGHVAEIRF